MFKLADKEESELLNMTIEKFIIFIRSYVLRKCFIINDNYKNRKLTFEEKIYINKLMKIATKANEFDLNILSKKKTEFNEMEKREIDANFINSQLILFEIVKEFRKEMF